MTYRIGWLSPFTWASGVGTFSNAVTRSFPHSYRGEEIDLTILHPAHPQLYRSAVRCIQIEDTPAFHNIMPLFDLLVYNIGNNAEHHDLIFKLLSMYPGIVICHDYVFQHYLVRRSMGSCRNFSSYGALLTKYGDTTVPSYIRRSRITSRDGAILYGPWDSEYSVTQPLSEILLDLGSALVLHSAFAYRRAKASFAGPVLKLGMPYDQKRVADDAVVAQWSRELCFKSVFRLVSFGHIQSTKCIAEILGAIASSKILRNRIGYTIAGFAGDPSYLSELQNLVAALSLREVVTFEIDVTEKRLAKLIGEADIFINLRRPNTEGSSASLIEQLESGKPVIVLDSGSYSEIPADAAVKLTADAQANDIRVALEHLVANPESLMAIGQAGQAHARAWSCVSYAEGLLRFVLKNRDLLHVRGRVVSIRHIPIADETSRPESDDTVCDDMLWQASLARARRSLRYLDKNMLALDPEIIMGMRGETLCTYVAQVIFGVFNSPAMCRTLSKFFEQRKGNAIYWDCVKFMLISDAVFDNDEAAQHRLLAMPASFDLKLWEVIEQFPAPQFWAAAHLLLHCWPVRQEHKSGGDECDAGHLNRLRILDLVEDFHGNVGDSESLKSWLEEPPAGALGDALSLIDQNLSVEIGGAEFRKAAALWGFHRMEANHAWMRGRRGFIGLKLARDVTKLALLVKHVSANAEKPCTIGLSNGTSQIEIQVRDMEPHWITLAVSADFSTEQAATWLLITTSHASPPPNSMDTRILGCCILRLEVNVKTPKQPIDLERILLATDA